LKAIFHHSMFSLSFLRKIFLAIACPVFLFSTSAFAQKKQDVAGEDAVEQKIETITESINQSEASDKELDYTTLLDQLNRYKEHPINLNNASRTDLENLSLLSGLQIQALLDHIDKNGKLISIEELQSIEGFDSKTIYNIQPFVKVSEQSTMPRLKFREALTQGRSVLFIRYSQILEEQKGFSPPDPANNDTHRYYGSAAKIYTRYRYTYNDQLSFGITGEKDAGEEFFKGTQKQGFDFYSAHLFYNGNSWLNSVALGDYQAQYGQGLVLWSGLAFGKSADVMSIKKGARGLVPYTSVDENLFMRGGAVSLTHKNFQLDLFYSNHKIDGNVQAKDTLTEEEFVSTFEEDGYHRDSSELAKKHSVGKTISGGHFQYTGKRLSIGFTGYSTMFSQPLQKDLQPYNKFDFSGDHNTNGGIDYNYVYRNINFFGEIGRSDNGGMATLNGLLASLDPNVQVSILYRHYDKDYQALESNALAENSHPANEDGLYFGIFMKPARYFTLSGYYDQFKFPWLRYQVDAPTKGNEYLAQLTYTPSKTFETYFRIKTQNKPKNITADTHPISNQYDVQQTNYRFHITYVISSSVSLANRVEYVDYKKGATPEKGYVLYQDVNYQPHKSKLSFTARYVLFDTDTYDTRIYAYESDVLYAYSIPSYYYRGSRFYIMAHYRIIRGIDCWVRYGTTVYDNQQTVGSGLDEIDGNRKSEIKAQVRFQF
jgi:DNA uptake protein ComE-like DNA-binding protein